VERSLSALLAVRNAEATLEGLVLDLLEVLPELTSRFQLVVVDDCSCDATIEVADDLAGSYPQLVVIRHAVPQGRAAAIQTALGRSRGEVIFLADEDCDLSLGEVRKLWNELGEHELVLARPAPGGQRRWSRRPRGPGCQRAYQMGFRRAFLALSGVLADQATLLEHLRRNGLQWREVEVSNRTPRSAPHQAARTARGLLARRPQGADQSQRADVPRPGSSRPKRPNYLTRLMDFALGE
jgi:glycosyltransferase involved in cell wall biosynthesis